MPPVSSSQRKLMRAAAASPEVRKRTGITKKVAAEFNGRTRAGSCRRRSRSRANESAGAGCKRKGPPTLRTGNARSIGSRARTRAIRRWPYAGSAGEEGQRRPAPIASQYFKGLGWAFPAHWVEPLR